MLPTEGTVPACAYSFKVKRRTKVILSLTAICAIVLLIFGVTRDGRIAYEPLASEDLGESGEYVLAHLASFGTAYPDDSADGRFSIQLMVHGLRVMDVSEKARVVLDLPEATHATFWSNRWLLTGDLNGTLLAWDMNATPPRHHLIADYPAAIGYIDVFEDGTVDVYVAPGSRYTLRLTGLTGAPAPSPRIRDPLLPRRSNWLKTGADTPQVEG